MTVAVIDYGAGNLRSVANALRAAGAADVLVTADPKQVATAGRIVLPGVGAFGACADELRAISGMEDALVEAVLHRQRPFLGICVGMQLMARSGEEFGHHQGLGWLAATVRRLKAPDLKIPHIGWNGVAPAKASLIEPGDAYFVHSYALVAEESSDIAATVDYGGPVVAAVQRANMLGVQFHPEKSQGYGLALLMRWLHWRP
jgi:glutamine amidotransferase